jgi:hypothetical protein
VKKDHVHRLYQWLSQRASFFRSDWSGGVSRTIRTEVTVERKEMSLLMGGAQAGPDHCPLCGQKLGPVQVEEGRLRLTSDSMVQESLPVDLDPP